ncbi:MAG: T9SS type A sorting domain-containing protein [Chitinophagales bacterium]|nr:T9SS type A sorting domain-containing protein [Chitinophagales bacterium]
MKFLPAIILLMSFAPCLLFSQVKHDYFWPFGNGKILVWGPYIQGGSMLDFNTSPPTITLHDFVTDYPFASIADKEGHLVAFTDGCRIANRNKELMLNGDTLNPGKVYNVYCNLPSFYPVVQPCIFLPRPGSDSNYYLFHLRSDNYYYNPMNLLYSEIDARGDNGNGAVVRKNIEVLSDSIYLGSFVTATKHANGRDWWVVVTRRFHSDMHVTLVTADTVQYMGMQDVGFTEVDSAYCCNQTRFTQDGSRLFRNHPGGMLILDFDRCSGTFSNPVYWDYTSMPSGTGGVAFSYDNRFLYLCSGTIIQQYDLNAPNILASREIVAEYDGFEILSPTNFFHAQLGPDGKIYVLTTGNNNILHVIHHPNKKGLSCMVEQRGVTLPGLGSFFEPNFPNYRLGPIDGSPCDTLGIDNLPVAHFRPDVVDTLAPQLMEFTDLSYYEPATWHWDFGDGATSQDTSPVHLYQAPGVYSVCLTVCNANACDTACQEIEVKALSSTKDQAVEEEWSLYPNPAGETLHLQTETAIETLRIFDATGREMHSFSVTQSKEGATVQIRQLPGGMYYLVLRSKDEVWSGKFVKR